jgi:hypothetical protein
VPVIAGLVSCGLLVGAACTTGTQTLALLPDPDAGLPNPTDAGDPDGGSITQTPPGAIWTQWVPPKPTFSTIVSPSARSISAMDFHHGVSLLFGGCAPLMPASTDPNGADEGVQCDMVLNDNWEWTGEKWLQIKPQNSPSPRIYTGLAFDADKEVSVLFGGLACAPPCENGGTSLGDLWTWNSRYDSKRNRIVLFGGVGAAQSPLGDTWEWDGTNWTEMSPPVSPAPRTGHAMTFDAARNRTVLFGGYACPDADCSGVLTVANDTWEWDGTNWTQPTVSTSPPGRATHVLSFDSDNNLTILFGGANASFQTLNDTWVWDGVSWVQLFPVESPPPRMSPAMTYDPLHANTVLFGGYDTNLTPNVAWDDLWKLSVFPDWSFWSDGPEPRRYCRSPDRGRVCPSQL